MVDKVSRFWMGLPKASRRWLVAEARRNHTCRSMDALMERVRRCLEERRRTGRHRYVRAA